MNYRTAGMALSIFVLLVLAVYSYIKQDLFNAMTMSAFGLICTTLFVMDKNRTKINIGVGGFLFMVVTVIGITGLIVTHNLLWISAMYIAAGIVAIKFFLHSKN